MSFKFKTKKPIVFAALVLTAGTVGVPTVASALISQARKSSSSFPTVKAADPIPTPGCSHPILGNTYLESQPSLSATFQAAALSRVAINLNPAPNPMVLRML